MLNVSLTAGVGHLELDRPEARNALDRALCTALSRQLDAWASDGEVRAVVISGAGGKAFAAGADIAELKARTHAEAFLAFTQRVFQQVEDFPRPVIAAIDGYALGGGMELALACDLRVATRRSKVGFPEVTLGIFPSAGASTRLPRLVGLGRARELIFTGRIVEATEAQPWGLFEALVEDDALGEALRLGALIAANAPLAVQVAKVSLNAVARGVDAAPLEWLGQALLFDSEDKDARMTAFLSRKKKP